MMPSMRHFVSVFLHCSRLSKWPRIRPTSRDTKSNFGDEEVNIAITSCHYKHVEHVLAQGVATYSLPVEAFVAVIKSNDW